MADRYVKHQGARDPIVEPHDLSPRWLGENKAAVWTPLTPDDVEEKRRFVPKKNLPCHGEEKQRLGFITRDGEVVALEKGCAVCRARTKEAAEQFAFQSGNIDRLATEWLRKHGKERVTRKGHMTIKGENE